MQQAIFLDIALFVPGVIVALSALLGQVGGGAVEIPPGVAELGSDAVFVTMLAALGYASVSSLLGVTPNKLPFVSQAAEDRIVSADWFDEQGNFVPRDQRQSSKQKQQDDDKKNE